MRIDVVTLFPEMVEHAAQFGVVGRALTKTLWSLALWNPRTFTSDPHRTVDDRPYGGGPGMVMLAAPLAAALKAARAAQAEAGCAVSRVLYLSPAGTPLTHARVTALNALARQGTGLIVLAGRYEGIDERLLMREVDEEIAVGDFVVSGGELPALMLIDALVRQLPGALNDAASAEEESFVDGLLDCPHYTRPPVYEGEAVPEVLLSGDHAAIESWRRMQSLGRTMARRPDLLAQRELMKGALTKEEKRLLERYQQKE
ncbi:MAG: tRNA (guanosine(37)-N1)-methyltransferase TrmD [Burkholderiales bacterium]|nr:tRNA (guanosine(37)-N1)-methyltransferase TrmD [Burkholderiales bacterium]